MKNFTASELILFSPYGNDSFNSKVHYKSSGSSGKKAYISFLFKNYEAETNAFVGSFHVSDYVSDDSINHNIINQISAIQIKMTKQKWRFERDKRNFYLMGIFQIISHTLTLILSVPQN